MRLFIAFDVSEEVAVHLKEVQKQLQTDNVKLTLSKHSHLTLKFLGDLSAEQADEIKKQLESVEFSPFTATLTGTGIFPSEDHIRVVWVGVDPADVIIDLHKKIDAALTGVPKAEKFKPHITLARVKTIKDKKQFSDHVKDLKIQPLTFEVKEIKLVESKLEKEGPVYRDVATYPVGNT